MELFPKYYFGIIFTLLLAGMLLYLRAAKKWSITDNPNERSSHKQITLRGGGLIYLFGLGLYLIFSNFNIYLLVTSGVFLGIVGFIDDIKNLSFKIKLLFQLIIITIYLLGTIYLLEWYLIVLIFIFLIGSINVYNFMDGINGLTILYSLTSLVTFYVINSSFFQFTDANLLLVMIICNLIIGFFNIRKQAICFLGDVGSITMGFLFGSLVILLMLKTNSLNPLILFIVYGVDAGWTIIQRLINRENIFLPHRKHLYQLLVNELKFSHLLVSIIYFFIQAVVNIIWIYFYQMNLSIIVLIIVIAVFSLIYLLIKQRIINKLKLS